MLATNEQPSLLRLRLSGSNTWLECGADAGGVYFLDDEEACWCVFVWTPPHTHTRKRQQQLVLTTTQSLSCVNRLRKLSVLTHFSNAKHLSLKWRVFHLQYEKSLFFFKCLCEEENDKVQIITSIEAPCRKRLPDTTRLLEFEKCNSWMST